MTTKFFKLIMLEGRPKSSRYAIQQGEQIDFIKSIGFGFENMEWYDVPIECFESLSINFLDFGKCEIDCHVIDNGGIEADSYGAEYTFAQRVKKHKDVDCIRLNFENDDWLSFKPVWYFSDFEYSWEDENNAYQKTTFHSYKEVEFSIAKHNKIYTIEEVLSIGMNKETIFEDEVGIIYKAKGGSLFVMGDTTPLELSLQILNAKFTKVD